MKRRHLFVLLMLGGMLFSTAYAGDSQSSEESKERERIFIEEEIKAHEVPSLSDAVGGVDGIGTGDGSGFVDQNINRNEVGDGDFNSSPDPNLRPPRQPSEIVDPTTPIGSEVHIQPAPEYTTENASGGSEVTIPAGETGTGTTTATTGTTGTSTTTATTGTTGYKYNYCYDWHYWHKYNYCYDWHYWHKYNYCYDWHYWHKYNYCYDWHYWHKYNYCYDWHYWHKYNYWHNYRSNNS
jgi:hypothetical protein